MSEELKRTFNPCDECKYGIERRDGSGNDAMCRICEFSELLNRRAEPETGITATEVKGVEIDTVKSDHLANASELINAPLTLDELRGMIGEWVWVEHMESSASLAEPGEWLKLETCEPTRLDPYIRFNGKSLCAIYYDQSWLAYRHKPEGVCGT